MTHYLIDPIGLGNVVGEYDAIGNLIAGYDHGFGLLSRTAGGASGWYTFDAIGNTTSLTDAAQTLINSYVYAPFGDVLLQTGSASNVFQFVGELGVTESANELNLMGVRGYSPVLARFIQADPLGILGGSNLYRYAANNPSSAVDAMGLSPMSKEQIEDIVRNDVNSAYREGKHGSKDSNWVARGQNGYMKCSDWQARMKDLLKDTGWTVEEKGREGEMPWYYSFLFPQDWGKEGTYYEHFWVEITNPETGEKYRVDPWEFPFDLVVPADDRGGGVTGTAGAGDPNQKLGSVGFGTQGYIDAESTLSYRIDFENDPAATAPAQIVTITDQLDTDLDWNSFALTELGFGDHLIAVPANSQYFETTVPMQYNGQDFEVQIAAGIDFATGLVFASFYSIDPFTGLPPDVLTGFLPPEDGTGRGMGYVSYVVDQKTGLATSTEIRNIAYIVFDGQPAIATNQVDPHDASKGIDPAKEALNTIDAGDPTSAVLPLPAQVTQSEFLVSWAGADDAGGSGIASYEIFVSDNGGAFSPWLSDTTLTTASFLGHPGHSYAFYSQARDHAGNTEPAPTLADTRTTVRPIENLDVDGNHVYDAETDGKLLLRYLAGAPDGQLVAGSIIGPNATRTTAEQIRAYLDPVKLLMLDVDGDGRLNPFTDGRLLYRFLQNAMDAQLMAGNVVGPGALRFEAAALRSFMSLYSPTLTPLSTASETLAAPSTTAALSTASVMSAATVPAGIPLTTSVTNPAIPPLVQSYSAPGTNTGGSAVAASQLQTSAMMTMSVSLSAPSDDSTPGILFTTARPWVRDFVVASTVTTGDPNHDLVVMV
jgi:RHS repeat-associated protein